MCGCTANSNFYVDIKQAQWGTWRKPFPLSTCCSTEPGYGENQSCGCGCGGSCGCGGNCGCDKGTGAEVLEKNTEVFSAEIPKRKSGFEVPWLFLAIAIILGVIVFNKENGGK